MKEWGVPFHVIENEWTDDQFIMMVEKLGERLQNEAKAIRKNNRKDSQADRHNSKVQSRQLDHSEAIKLFGAKK